MSELKICSQCHTAKEAATMFYQHRGRWRSECKGCTIKHNIRYQKRNKSWKERYVDDEARKLYMRDYYEKNKEKFAEYRAVFKAKYPEYYKDYFRSKKEKS